MNYRWFEIQTREDIVPNLHMTLMPDVEKHDPEDSKDNGGHAIPAFLATTAASSVICKPPIV